MRINYYCYYYYSRSRINKKMFFLFIYDLTTKQIGLITPLTGKISVHINKLFDPDVVAWR